MSKFNLNYIKYPEFDYLYLMSLLSSYRRPVDKISELIRLKKIIRVKRGIYVISEGGAYSIPILANMLFGPSYISKEFALMYHGLIPEYVHTITSMTCKRNKTFHTQIGIFTYDHISTSRFSIAISRVNIDHKRSFLIATPEKALADKLIEKSFKNSEDLEGYLFEGLRIDRDRFKKFSSKRVAQIQKTYNKPVLKLFFRLLENLKNE